MATTLNINPELLAEAMRLSGAKTKKEVVNMALEEFVRRKKQLEFISIFGTIEYDEEYDYKNHRDK
ncbi:MAG: type II toxin-antitoxin system VapB family antitoxin [Bacteroidia bacterium]|nr:type II toxin-antitoxin system VapB family antitoxin [Bacteroidia bacterium]